MTINKVALAVTACIGAAIVAIPAAMCLSDDKGAVAIAGIGALGQVIVAVLLYFLTREQLEHARGESRYRKLEQAIAKRERRLADMLRVQAMFANARSGIGKTSLKPGQVDRLEHLRDDMRQFFAQPVSRTFNRLVDSAAEAAELGVDHPGYLKKITSFKQLDAAVYNEIKPQIDAERALLDADQQRLDAC